MGRVPLDRPTAGENAEQDREDRSALKPKMLKVHGKPSESERRRHELTHLPCRDWSETVREVERKTKSCSEEEECSSTGDPG